MIYTYSHFGVDFACFYVLIHGFQNRIGSLEAVALGFLLYNAIAFGLQFVIGYLCDENQQIPIALIGTLLVVTGVCLMMLPWVAVVVCALGNACFHVGGGRDSLVLAEGKMSRSGVFVSSGALGVVLGTRLGQSEISMVYLVVGVMLLSILGLLLITKNETTRIPCRFHATSDLPVIGILILAIIPIIIRSYAGGLIPTEWKMESNLWLLPGLATFTGKAIGGFLGDKFGARNAGVLSLVSSIPFLYFGQNSPLLSVVGIILFNVTMPIILCTIASQFPYHPGLAFGITTLALLCGSVPVYLFVIMKEAMAPVMIILILFAAICTFVVTKNMKGDKFYENITE